MSREVVVEEVGVEVGCGFAEGFRRGSTGRSGWKVAQKAASSHTL